MDEFEEAVSFIQIKPFFKILHLKTDDFWGDQVTLLIENARSYYKDVDQITYDDAEVLQDIFWQAFQGICD